MQPGRHRIRSRNGRLQKLAMIAAVTASLAAGPAAGERVLADARERTAGDEEIEARAEQRGERASKAARRGGSEPAPSTSESAGRRGRSPGSPAAPPETGPRPASAPVPTRTRGERSTPAPSVPDESAPSPTSLPTSSPIQDPSQAEAVEDAKARVAQMQALSEAHAREMAEDARRFQEQMRAATTPTERTALQQEYQRDQARKSEALQQRLRALQRD